LAGKKASISFKDITGDEAGLYVHDTEAKQHLSCLKACHLLEPQTSLIKYEEHAHCFLQLS